MRRSLCRRLQTKSTRSRSPSPKTMASPKRRNERAPPQRPRHRRAATAIPTTDDGTETMSTSIPFLFVLDLVLFLVEALTGEIERRRVPLVEMNPPSPPKEATDTVRCVSREQPARGRTGQARSPLWEQWTPGSMFVEYEVSHLSGKHHHHHHGRPRKIQARGKPKRSTTLSLGVRLQRIASHARARDADTPRASGPTSTRLRLNVYYCS